MERSKSSFDRLPFNILVAVLLIVLSVMVIGERDRRKTLESQVARLTDKEINQTAIIDLQGRVIKYYGDALHAKGLTDEDLEKIQK